MMTLNEYKNEFKDRKGVHFNNAGMAPISARVAELASTLVTRNQIDASFADPDWVPNLRKTREEVAQFLGTKPESVAFFQNCAEALSTIALGFPFQKGDMIITVDQEYASNYYPWMMAAERSGANLEVVESGKNETLTVDSILEKLNPRVKLVAVSWVQFQTGSIIDLKKLGDACHQNGAYLIVDGIQALGQLPFSLESLPVDAIVGGSHKWLCSLNGQGFMAIKNELLEKVSPSSFGSANFNRFGTFADPKAALEKTARKFEAGGFAYLPLFSLQSAIQLVNEVGIDTIQTEISRLSCRFREGLQTISKVNLVTPLAQVGGITSFQLPLDQEVQFLRRCREEKVALVKRGPYLRASIHAFCNDEEVDLVLTILRGVCS